MKRCIASAQALENHAIHSRNGHKQAETRQTWAYERRATRGRTPLVTGMTESASDAVTAGKSKRQGRSRPSEVSSRSPPGS
ncbi:unnamed protein product, partial [Ectocarpus sp. 8 AP-2014]